MAATVRLMGSSYGHSVNVSGWSLPKKPGKLPP